MSRSLAEILIQTGYWPPEIDFTAQDLNTAIDVLNKQRKATK